MSVFMNNLEWDIILCEQGEIKKMYKEKSGEDSDVVFGFTDYYNQTIYLDENLTDELTRITLIHELMHVFMFSYGFNRESYSEEDVCHMVGASLDIIYDILNDVEHLRKLTKVDNYVEELLDDGD